MRECPPEVMLEQFLAGLLADNDTTRIDDHVSSCETCAIWLEEARADEELLPALRGVEPGPDTASPAPDQIAGYKILQRLGEGGMGVVFEAEQENPRRRVALKVLRAGVASPRMLRRFEHEAQVLGLLQHPGIAQIHEAGTFQSEHGSQPFFAMELVHGRPLMEYVRSQRPDLHDSLALMIKICEAVHHAHQKGVIHRDLKPGNILVNKHGQPKVLDFGVARLTDRDMAATLQTRAGELIGTLSYMSPEQVSGDPAAIDTRSDVYTLAAICYQVLTSRLPHDLKHKSVPEAVRTIGEDEPTLLSSIDRSLRGDLETIVLKGLEKDRDRRYQSAAELGLELGRFLRNEPIAARPPSTLYQLRKFARRNKALVGGVVAVFVVLVAGIVVSLVLWNKAEDAAEVARVRQKQAEEESAQAAAARDFLQEVLIQASPEQRTGGEPTIRDALATALARVDQMKGRPHVEAAVRHTLGRVHGGLHKYAKAEAQLTRSLELYEGLYGKQHPKIAYVLGNLAEVHTRQGRYDEAEATARRALSMRGLLQPHPTILASALGGLGLALYQKGRFAEAEQYTSKAMHTYQRLEGPDGVNVAITKGMLARIVSHTGKPKETEQLFREALARQRELLGRSNPTVAITTGSLAGFLASQGRLAEAEKLQREALSIQEAAFPGDHPAVGEARQELGWLLCQRHQKEGLLLLRDGVDIQKRALSKNHPRVARGLLSLGTAQFNSRQYKAAESTFREAVKSATIACGASHLQTIKCISGLGCSLARQGKHEDAVPLLEKSYALAKNHLPKARSVISTSRAEWILCLIKLRRGDEARGLLKEILETTPPESAEARWAQRMLAQLQTTSKPGKRR